MENVGALTFRGLDAVLGSLAEIGYNAEWQDIRASDMGAPHRRERIWIIAYPSGIGWATRGYNEREHKYNISEIREAPENQQSGNIGECGSIEICPDYVADTNSQGLQGRTTPGKSGVIGENREQFIERQGEQPGRGYWSTESAVGRLVNGLPGRVDRLKGLGNSIVPQIAEILFNQIKPLL